MSDGLSIFGTPPRPALTWGTNQLVVDPNGDDANPGNRGYRTLAAALAIAAAGEMVAAKPGTYTEGGLVVPDDIALNLSGATLVGNGSPNVTLGLNSALRVGAMTVPAGQVGVILSAADAEASVEFDSLNVEDGGEGISLTGARTIARIRCARLFLGAGSVGVGSLTTMLGHADIDIDHIIANAGGAAAVAVACDHPGAVSGRIGFMEEDGGVLTAISVAGGNLDVDVRRIAATDGIVMTGGGARVDVPNLVASNDAYNVGAAGVLTLETMAITGNEIVAGTVNLRGFPAITNAGDPNGGVTGHFGQLCHNTVGASIHFCTSNPVGTVWIAT